MTRRTLAFLKGKNNINPKSNSKSKGREGAGADIWAWLRALAKGCPKRCPGDLRDPALPRVPDGFFRPVRSAPVLKRKAVRHARFARSNLLC